MPGTKSASPAPLSLAAHQAVIAGLPDGLHTYLDPPVQDLYGDVPAGTRTLFGRRVDYGGLRAVGGMSSTGLPGPKCGQMQRLTV